MKVADIVEFKRKGFMSWFLGGLLKLFNPSWDGYGWHLAILWQPGYDGWYILEATGQGVRKNWYDRTYLQKNTRIWSWLDEAPLDGYMKTFLARHINKRYDVAVYIHTLVQYLLLRAIEWFQKTFIPWHKFNISLPRVLNNRWTCWEIVFWFCRDMGKPIQESIGLDYTRYPLITDFLRAVTNR